MRNENFFLLIYSKIKEIIMTKIGSKQISDLNLSNLDDVNITSLQDGQYIVYNSGNNEWVNADVTTGIEVSGYSIIGTPGLVLNRSIINKQKIIVSIEFNTSTSGVNTELLFTDLVVIPQGAGGATFFKVTNVLSAIKGGTGNSVWFGNLTFSNMFSEDSNNFILQVAGNGAGKFNQIDDTLYNTNTEVDNGTIDFGEYNPSVTLVDISSSDLTVSYNNHSGIEGIFKVLIEGYLI